MSSSAEKWVNSEFKSVSFGDTRLNTRLINIVTRLASRFGDNISSSFSEWKDIKATYRFFSNKKVSLDAILMPHIEETISRIKSHGRVFLVQDTTYFNFSNRDKTQGLDITQRNKISKDTEGLMLHNTLAVSDSGVPLGLIDQHYIDRKSLQGSSHKEKRSLRHWNNNINKKESKRWVDILVKASRMDFGKTEIIHVADRESDIYEFFREAADLKEHVLIRAARNRAINKTKRREAPSEFLFDHLKGMRAKGRSTISIQVNGKKKFREAFVSVIYTTISMPPPSNKTENKDGYLPMIELSAIMAIERNPPKGCDALCWVLLTDLPINSLDDAIEKIRW